MSVSTDTILCFGIQLEEEGEFPWQDEKYDDGWDDWWREIAGCPDRSLEFFTPEGGLREDFDQERCDVWYSQRRAWDLANPMPVEIVRHCSYGYPMYIVAAKNSVTEAARGFPEMVPFNQLNSHAADGFDAGVIRGFIEQHELPINPKEPEARWWLCSFWEMGG